MTCDASKPGIQISCAPHLRIGIISTSWQIGLDEFTSESSQEECRPAPSFPQIWRAVSESDGGRISKRSWMWGDCRAQGCLVYLVVSIRHFVVSSEQRSLQRWSPVAKKTKQSASYPAANSRTSKVGRCYYRIPSNTTFLTGKPWARILFREKQFQVSDESDI